MCFVALVACERPPANRGPTPVWAPPLATPPVPAHAYWSGKCCLPPAGYRSRLTTREAGNYLFICAEQIIIELVKVSNDGGNLSAANIFERIKKIISVAAQLGIKIINVNLGEIFGPLVEKYLLRKMSTILKNGLQLIHKKQMV